MRLIDADALLKNVDKYPYAQGLMDLIADIQTAPSIDIVRCRECIHYGRDSERNTYGCNLHSIGMTPSDYCSYGERKDSE